MSIPLSNPTEHPWGYAVSDTTYKGGCRCEECKYAHTVYETDRANIRHARLAELPADRHGLNATYANWRCRCTLCRQAHAEYLSRYRGKKLRRHGTSVAPVQSVDQTQSVMTCDLGFTHIVVS